MIFKNVLNKFGHGISKHVRGASTFAHNAINQVDKAAGYIMKQDHAMGEKYRDAKKYLAKKAQGTIFAEPLHNLIAAAEHTPLAGAIRDTRELVRDMAKETRYQLGKSHNAVNKYSNRAIGIGNEISGLNRITPSQTTTGQASAFLNS